VDYKSIYFDNYMEYRASFSGMRLNGQIEKLRNQKIWIGSYPNAEFQVINRENYLAFIL